MANRAYPQGAQPPSVDLMVNEGPHRGQRYALTRPAMTLGRDPGNDVVIAHPQVSRQHASLTWDGRYLFLQDLGSANGTFVNGLRLAGPQALSSGDVIGLGQEVNLVVVDRAPVQPPAMVHVEAPAAPPPYQPDRQAPPRRSRRLGVLLPLIIALVLACALVLAAAVGFRAQAAEPGAVPQVSIHSPQHGQRVEVGRVLTVHAVARDAQAVTRLELWIDGRLQATQESNLPGGTSPLPLVARWEPPSPGTYTLIARAVNTRGARAQASVTVEAAQLPDQDGDGVLDDADLCPGEPGSATAAGCPDRDGDGIADREDDCPQVAGLPGAAGCPTTAEGDRDGDGVLDGADACPDSPGAPRSDGCPDADGDSVPDGEDACPDEAGWPEHAGCLGSPDVDGDGVPDAGDACPAEPGSVAAEGCPDADADGVPDAEDACPEEPGLPGSPAGDGCPDPGAPDADGDGVPDADDACPAEPGPPSGVGCPDADGDGVPDSNDACPAEPGPQEREGCPLQAGESDSDSDGVPDGIDACPGEWGLPERDGCPEPGGSDAPGEDAESPGPVQEAEPAGDGDGAPDPAGDDPPRGIWGDLDWAGLLFGAHVVPPATLVEVQLLEFQVDHDYTSIHCYLSLAGSDVERHGPFEPLGERQWAIPEDLRSRRVLVEEGQPLELQAECSAEQFYPEEGGAWGAYYDLGSAQASHGAGDWDGHVIRVQSSGGHDGHRFQATYRLCEGSCDEAAFPPPGLSLFSGGGDRQLIWMWSGDHSVLEGYNVYVDGAFVFRVTGRASQSVSSFEPPCGSDRDFHITAYGAGRESPPSNTVTWRGPPCPRVVRVAFDRLHTFDLEDRRFGSRAGPIWGDFLVQGTTEAVLSFYATDYPDGVVLASQANYDVQSLFNTMRAEGYRAPDTNAVTVELGPYDDLTVGGTVHDQDWRSYETLFHAWHTIPAGELVPGQVSLHDGQIRLDVLIDVIVGPEAGERPDLAITGVTVHEPSGQLRVHVFNNAADLVDQDVTVRVETVVSRAEIATLTWQNVSIPSGGERILMNSDLVHDPYGIRVILDPQDTIDEENEDNNVYLAPVLMRVEFQQLYIPGCACESFLAANSEHRFHFYAGHGPSAGPSEWLHQSRYPASGEVSRRTPTHTEDDPPVWDLTGQPQYTFEFQVPADERLYLKITGFEIDSVGPNDPMGTIEVSYGPTDGWGDGTATSWVRSSGYGTVGDDCNEGECRSLIDRFIGFEARWRITRVR